MQINYEDTVQGLVVLTAKQYIQRLMDGSYKFKGVHQARKDRALIISRCVRQLCDALMEGYQGEELYCRYAIAIDRALQSIALGTCTLRDVAVERRVGGSLCLEYRNRAGKVVLVQNASVESPLAYTTMVSVHIPSLVSSLEKATRPMCRLIGFSTISALFTRVYS